MSLLNDSNTTLLAGRLRYISLGASKRIGASAHYLRLDRWGILLDAGLDPALPDASGIPNYELIRDEPVNAIIISHAHLDHLGSLPVAIRYFPHARVYMTPATAVLAESLLFHYLKVRRKQAQEIHQTAALPYTEAEVENILYLFQSFEYDFPFLIHSFQESQIEIVFKDAGHILGSAGVEIRWRGKRIFYTGNTRKSSQFILKGARYPEHCDILLTETTYGADAQAPATKKSAEVNRFARFLKEHLNFGGAVLIPVFALGRTQEILVLVHQLMQKNKIPVVPIYVTGFGVEINRIYDRLLHKVYPEYEAKKLRTISALTLRGKRFRKPAIILATSGMMWPGTLSYEIARDFLQDARNAIAFVGWADPETPGGVLREQKSTRIQEIFGVEELQCKVEVFRFSAHSHREELLSMIRRLRPSVTILCHGDAEAQRWMAEAISREGLSKQVIQPEEGVWYNL